MCESVRMLVLTEKWREVDHKVRRMISMDSSCGRDVEESNTRTVVLYLRENGQKVKRKKRTEQQFSSLPSWTALQELQLARLCQALYPS
jgi:hypothetical protein